MYLARARQKDANPAWGQFKFFEVFMAAECRQIPGPEAPATVAPGVFGSGLEAGPPIGRRSTRGYRSLSIGCHLAPVLLMCYVLVAEAKVFATSMQAKILPLWRVASTWKTPCGTLGLNIGDPCSPPLGPGDGAGMRNRARKVATGTSDGARCRPGPSASQDWCCQWWLGRARQRRLHFCRRIAQPMATIEDNAPCWPMERI